MNENFSNQTNRVPYMGGDFVTCPRCSNVVNNRYCDYCGLDLSLVYSKDANPNEQPQILNQPNSSKQYGQQCGPQQQQPFASIQQPNIQYPYNEMYNYPQYRSKKRGWIFIVIAVAVILGFYLVVGLTSFGDGFEEGFWEGFNDSKQHYSEEYINPPAQDDFYFAGGVSKEEFDKLEKGMSYAQVSSIIGGDGQLSTSGENLKDEPYYTYGWVGENNPDAIVYITITNDQVTEIMTHGEL